MKIQKKNSNTISFDFKEEYFIYKLKDRNNTQTKEIGYLGVNLSIIDDFIERQEWFRNVGFIWIAISLFELLITRSGGAMWLLLGLIMLGIYYVRTTRFSVVQSDDGNFLIIKDKKHDAILKKIRSEKQRLLREKLFYLEATNSRETEIRKFQYLRDNEAISHEEFTDMCNKLSENIDVNVGEEIEEVKSIVK